MKQYKYPVIGYAYKETTYCTECIVKALKDSGDVYEKFNVVDLNATLDTLAETYETDRNDVWDLPNTMVPKEIFDIDTEYDIDICKICDRIIGS